MTDRQAFVDLVEVRHPVDAPMGPTILAGLFAGTWLAEHSDDDVLDTTWVMAADVHEERHTLPGVADPSRIRLHQGRRPASDGRPDDRDRGIRLGL